MPAPVGGDFDADGNDDTVVAAWGSDEHIGGAVFAGPFAACSYTPAHATTTLSLAYSPGNHAGIALLYSACPR